MTPPRQMIFLDHTGTPGGGQLEAFRLLPRLSAIRPHSLFITGGVTADGLAAKGIDVTVLDRTHHFRARRAPSYARGVWREIRRTPRGTPIVALSTAAAQVLAFLPRAGHPRILRLNEDMQRFAGRGWKSLLYFSWIFRRYDIYIANSSWTRETIPHSLRRVPAYTAFSLSGLSEPLKRPHPILANQTVRVACFSRSARWKGLDIAIKAIDIVAREGHDVALDLFGGDWQSEEPYREELHDLAARSAARISFRGHTDHVLDTMAGLDIVIMPSRLPEPFGQVTVQSLAAGCLTITSGHGGSLELVEDGVTGLTFANDDERDLARALVWALSNRTEARRIAEAGARSASELTDAVLARGLEEALLHVSSDEFETSSPRVSPETSR